jgi:lipoate-protein ligase A
MSQQIWRLIETGPLSGAENMAVDEALLNSFLPESSSPILRLYSWNPPALSLGRFQKAAEVLDMERCCADNISILRRITGGGVIYHADELTYSIICSPEQIPPASSVKDTFRVLTRFLLEFYTRLGLKVAYASESVEPGVILGARTPFCFAGRESFDIKVNGRKIGGNAQRRLKGLIFQHGSIPVINRSEKGLSYMLERDPQLITGTTGIVESSGGIAGAAVYAPPYTMLFEEFKEAFKACFAIDFSEETLSPAEQALAAELLQTRYMKNEWNIEGITI